MLRFILGRSGSGKTAAIYNQIKERIEGGEGKILMLIPDQSSFETEKDFLELLGARKSKNVTVFGFDGLCRAVFEQTGNVAQNVIDDGTRAVLMSMAVEELTEKRKVLTSVSNRGLSELMLTTLKECKKNGVSADMLEQAAQKLPEGTLSAKLSETALVFRTFDALLSQSYVDPLDNLARAEKILLENIGLFRGYVLYVDSFSGFTAVQQRILRILLNRCRECTVSLCLDPDQPDGGGAFATTAQTYKSLKMLAKKDGIPIKTPVKLTEPVRFRHDSLRQLEREAFGFSRQPSDRDPQHITLYSAGDVYDECTFAARQIKRLIIEKGCLYSDIAVICNDLTPYMGTLNVIFDKYDIPYFMDSTREIAVMPPVRLINAVFRLTLNGFKREDILALLKTGLTNNSEKEISTFENYIYIWNLSGKALAAPFTKNPRGFSDVMTDDDEQNLAEAERVRRSVMEPLLRFREDIKDSDGKKISRLLYELLVELGSPEALNRMVDRMEESGEPGEGADQVRIWAMLMTALDKTVAAAGDLPLSPKRYYELLSIQISALRFMDIPQTADCVNVTTAQRLRNSTQKVSFLIGCNDGVFPAVPHTSGLFSAFELKVLSQSDITIGDDFAALANLETFMTYSCLASASERLFISCPLLDSKGGALQPSVIYDEVRKSFPNISLLDKADFDDRADSMLALQPAFEAYAQSLYEGAAELNGLGEFFASDSRFASKTEAIRRALDKTPFHMENPESAEKLFGKDLTISASQIEKFSLCRFAYFCNYGLRVRERLKAEINQMEYGTLVHYVLEKFFSQYSKKEYSAMSDDELSDFIRKTVNAYLEDYFGGGDEKPGNFLYQLEMLCRNLLLLLRHLTDELSQSDFSVEDCELNIGSDIPAYTIKLPTGHNIAVCGSVDRVDVLRSGDIAYLRVVDYKTGAKEFKLSDILYGLNLQMLLYLYAVTENGGERYGSVTPAGILYMPAGVPVVAADNLDGDAIAAKISDHYKMNGLLLDDVRVIKGMDKSESATYIPVKIKNGSNSGAKSLATLAQFGQLFKKLDATVAAMGKALYDGKIEASPVKGAHDACEYCPYDSICAYCMSEPRSTFGVDKDEVFKQLDREQGGEDDA